MKKAFTMLELVFVIVVIGILAATIIPSTRTNPVPEASIDLVSKIKYAQHLAMVDDKFNATAGSNWMQNRWQITLVNNKYSIVSDNDTTYAVDPSNKDEDIQDIDLNAKYGVTVALTGGCNAQTDITFDHLGRPHVGEINDDTTPYVTGQLMTSACIITVSNGSDPDKTIHIEPETGYTHIM